MGKPLPRGLQWFVADGALLRQGRPNGHRGRYSGPAVVGRRARERWSVAACYDAFWMRRAARPVLIFPGSEPLFPDPRRADPDGLVAVGGDLEPARLLLAYQMGIFTWFEGMPLLWWSPDPRAVIDPTTLHVSTSLRRRLRRGRFSISFNRCFTEVMQACADRAEGTWITDEMLSAYRRLHELGHAHSVEVWMQGRLAGGLYGVQRGALFAAESMFHYATDASKIALVSAVRSLFTAGIALFDVQFLTSHLDSMGCYEIPRTEYLRRLESSVVRTPSLVELVLDWRTDAERASVSRPSSR
jgi:leucyl/phenylalanyl-tRNA--protein transferase